MPHIEVDACEANMITSGGRTVHVRDPQGKLIGFITPTPPQEELASALERLAEGPRGRTYSTQEVLSHLQSLDG